MGDGRKPVSRSHTNAHECRAASLRRGLLDRSFCDHLASKLSRVLSFYAAIYLSRVHFTQAVVCC